jgi:DNA-binding response OmpR family regulator
VKNQPIALIIEDDNHLGWIFDLTLQVHFKTEQVASSSAAKARLGQIVPNLIVLDLDLAGGNGQEILAWIHRDCRFDYTRVFLCTQNTIQAEMLQEAVDIVLLKPISLYEFREITSQFFYRRNDSRQLLMSQMNNYGDGVHQASYAKA